MRDAVLCGLCAACLLGGCAGYPANLRKKGISEFQAGRIKQAESLFRSVLERWPSDPASLYYMGQIMYIRGRFREAIYYYECCLDADPAYPDARRGRVLSRKALAAPRSAPVPASRPGTQPATSPQPATLPASRPSMRTGIGAR